MSASHSVAQTDTAGRKISVADVRTALEQIAKVEPARCDRRVRDQLPPRYIDQGKPNCLIAFVLVRLGFSTGILRSLDREHPIGELVQAGVAIEKSRHPSLRRIDHTAMALLAYVQREQDCGVPWGRIVADAFRPPSRVFGRHDRRTRPWIVVEQPGGS